MTSLEKDIQGANARMDELEKKVENNEVSTLQGRLTATESSVSSLDINMDIVLDELKTCKDHIQFLSETNKFQDLRIRELQHEITNLQTRSMKYNIIVYGIMRSKKDEDCTALFHKFCQKLLRIQQTINVVVAHRLGQTVYSPMVVRLANGEDKRLIFEHVSNLKGRKKSSGSFYRVSDQVPGIRKEKDRRRRDILRDNNRLGPSEKLELSTVKGILYVKEGSKEVVYDSKIVCPPALESLDWLREKCIQANKIISVMGQSEDIIVDGSKFVAYSREVRTINEVNEGYAALRMKHPGARHIVCAFRMPNMMRAQYNDFCDDEEWGAGRILLKALGDNGHRVSVPLCYKIL